MVDKLLHSYGFEVGLGIVVWGVWCLAGRGVALIVLGLFLVLCSILSDAGVVNVRRPFASMFAWLGEKLSREREDE